MTLEIRWQVEDALKRTRQIEENYDENNRSSLLGFLPGKLGIILDTSFSYSGYEANYSEACRETDVAMKRLAAILAKLELSLTPDETIEIRRTLMNAWGISDYREVGH